MKKSLWITILAVFTFGGWGLAVAADAILPKATINQEANGLDNQQERILLQKLVHEVSCLRYEIRATSPVAFGIQTTPANCEPVQYDP